MRAKGLEHPLHSNGMHAGIGSLILPSMKRIEKDSMILYVTHAVLVDSLNLHVGFGSTQPGF